MNQFIEINSKDGKRVYINVSHILSVCETGENRCLITTDLPPVNDNIFPFYYAVDGPYDEVVALIKGGEG